MKRYRVVGWYSYDPHNDLMRPFPRVVYVEASDPAEASKAGERALDELHNQIGISVTLLNWYTKEEE